VRHLEAALIQQARLGHALDRAVGTSAEQSAYARLRAASEHVDTCDREVRELSPRTSEDARTPDAGSAE
jgi:hypothetical protein